jgi:septal ring factor EnvC (AmiA/AmiB activator)
MSVTEILTGENGGIVIFVLCALSVILGALFMLVKTVAPYIRKWMQLADDLNGTPARAGVPARPGMMERLASLDGKHEEQNAAIQDIKKEQTEQGKKLETIRHEVEFNNGSSVKDSAIRTENDVKAVRAEIEAVKGTVEAVRNLLEPGSTDGRFEHIGN